LQLLRRKRRQRHVEAGNCFTRTRALPKRVSK
jgi:hypothetical protein